MKHQGLVETKIIYFMGKHEPALGKLVNSNELGIIKPNDRKIEQ